MGTWQSTVVESDGGRYVETYTFYDSDNDNRVEYSYVPQDYSHIGYTAKGRWDLDLIGNLKLFLDPQSAKAIYNFHADKWQQLHIKNYITGIQLGLTKQLKEMEDASIRLDISDDVLTLETLSSKDRFDRVN